MKRRTKWLLLALLVALLVAGGLRTLVARKARQSAVQAQQAAQQTTVSITLQAGDLQQAQERELPLTLALSGALQARQTALVKARVAGELLDLRVREGDAVQAGQLLGRIDPSEFDARLRQARNQAQAAKAQQDIAQRNHDNNQGLVAQGFISATALATSQANLAAAQANLAAAQAAVDVAAKSAGDTLLRAPITGQIAQRLAQPGERVGVDAHIVEIVDLRALELSAALSAADALQVRVGQRAQLQVEGSTQTVAARVARINPSTAPGSRAVLVYLTVAPTPGLRQGQFVQGLLDVGAVRALALPLTAVRTDQPQAYVQVLANGQVQHAAVQLGSRSTVDGQTWVTLQGVAPAATVLAGSVGVLRPGTPVVLSTNP